MSAVGMEQLLKQMIELEEEKRSEPEYHDCPRAKLGTCDPTNPQPDCPDCGGKGYIEGNAR